MRSILLSCCLAAAAHGAEPVTLSSNVLRVELTPGASGFRVIERTSGDVLVAWEAVFARIAQEGVKATLTGPRRKDGAMVADLDFGGSAARGTVAFRFRRPEVLTYTLEAPNAEHIAQHLTEEGRHVYGIWEKPLGGGIDCRGADEAFIGFGSDDNARAPFFMTDKGYGLYTQTLALGRYTIPEGGGLRFRFRGGKLVNHLIYGPAYKDVLRRYNGLAGPARVPPRWAFGAIWWRNRTDQAELLRDLEDLQRLRLPATALWIDRPFTSGPWGWGNLDFNPAQFPEPKKMLAECRKRNVRLMIWIANRWTNRVGAEAREKGYLFDRGGRAAMDLRRRKVRRYCREKLAWFGRFGVQGFKIDRGSQGASPPELQNEIVTRFAQCAAESLQETHGDDWYIFGRNCVDRGRRYVGIWDGDVPGRYGGLRSSIQHALRCAAINFPMFGSDTGGYSPSGPADLVKRWAAFSCYTTMFEFKLRNMDIRVEEESELVRVVRKFARRHHRLIPYTYSCMQQGARSGLGPIRPMIFEFPDDRRFAATWDQYMFGPALLVAPICRKGETRKVVLPAGQWLWRPDRKTVYPGGGMVQVDADPATIPVFIRAGAIIPRGDVLRGNDNWTRNWKPRVDVELYPEPSGKGRFRYHTGERFVPISWHARDGKLTIRCGKLDHPGQLRIYARRLGEVRVNGRNAPGARSVHKDGRLVVGAVPRHGETVVEITGYESLFEP